MRRYDRLCRALLDSWKVDAHCRAEARLTVQVNVPGGLFDDSVYGREAEAGARSRCFRGEECVERAHSRLYAHSCAIVGHTHHHVLARHLRCRPVGILAVQCDVLRPDNDTSAAWHRITRVDDEVEENL